MLGPDGAPIAGALVHFPSQEEYDSTTTGSDGRFRLELADYPTGRARLDVEAQLFLTLKSFWFGPDRHSYFMPPLQAGTVDLGVIEEDLRDHYLELGAPPDSLTWALDGLVRCQPASLFEMLCIVIDNALIFSGNRLPSVDIASTHVDGQVLVRVTDAGPGISSTNWERAFRPLERLSDESPGVGMGLAIARRRAGLADGDLFIQPGTSGGTTVVLRLQEA